MAYHVGRMSRIVKVNSQNMHFSLHDIGQKAYSSDHVGKHCRRRTMRLNALIVAASLLAGGCSTLTDLGVVRKEGLRNDEGDLIGYKQLVRNQRTGEVFAQIQMFTPLRD